MKLKPGWWQLKVRFWLFMRSIRRIEYDLIIIWCMISLIGIYYYHVWLFEIIGDTFRSSKKFLGVVHCIAWACFINLSLCIKMYLLRIRIYMISAFRSIRNVSGESLKNGLVMKLILFFFSIIFCCTFPGKQSLGLASSIFEFPLKKNIYLVQIKLTSFWNKLFSYHLEAFSGLLHNGAFLRK